MDIGSIFLGWLLGMLSPVIVSRIKRKYSKSDLHKGILNELDNIQERMVMTASLLGADHGKYDKPFVSWCIDSLVSTKSEKVEIIDNWKSQLNLSDDEFSALRTHMFKKDGKGKSLKQIELAFYDLHLSDISLFSIEFQGLLFELRSRVSFYNDEVKKAEKYFFMTFDSGITDKNHLIIKEDLMEKYEIIQGLCVRVADQIGLIKNETKI